MASQRINVNSETDPEDIYNESEEIFATRVSSSPRHIGLALFGAMCLVGAACAALIAGSGSQPSANRITVRELLEGEDMIKVTTDNTMKLMKVHPKQKSKVRAAMYSGLAKFRNDARYQSMSQNLVTHEQKNDLLSMVAQMSDPHVQRVGFQIAKALKQGGSRENSKQHLMELLDGKQLPELRQLHDKLFHGVRKMAKKNAHFAVDHMRLIKALPDSSVSATSVKERLLSTGLGNNAGSIVDGDDVEDSGDTALDIMGFFGAFEEQARIVLDNLDEILPGFGKEDKIPSEAKSFVGLLDFLTQTTDCVGRAEGNDMKEGMCPLKYASAAFDAISCLDNELNLANQDSGVDLDLLASFFGSETAATTTKPAQAGWGFP